MRARLIAPALAVAGFVLTLEVVSWQNRPMPPATGWRGNLLITPAARTRSSASTVLQAAPEPVADPRPQDPPVPLPVAAAVAPPEAVSNVEAPDPGTTVPVYGEEDDARGDGSGNDRPRRK